MKYGYMRVSTKDKQDFLRQEYVFKDQNIDKVFCEKISGTKKALVREEFSKMVSELNVGDEVYFESMSRMARSVQDLIATTDYLINKKKVRVVFLKENLNFGGADVADAVTSLIFNMMCAFAQFERDLISDRTTQALKAIKESGRTLGKPRVYDESVVVSIREMRSTKSCEEISKELNIPKSTVYRLLKQGK